jgi:endonuclease I
MLYNILADCLKEGEDLMMKKITILFTLILFGVLLVSCGNQPVQNPIVLAYNTLEVGLTSPDTLASVSQDLTLPTTLPGIDNLVIIWSSDNEAIISASGEVVRQNIDVSIVLTAKLTIDDQERFKFFTVTVIKLDDSEAPVIFGAKDVFLDLGATNPDYLIGVTAVDAIDGSVIVEVDASNVNVNLEGTYEITYSASDLAGNTASVTVTVTVVDEVMLTITEVIGSVLNNEVKTEGSVTALYETDTQLILYIQDSAQAIRIEAPKSFAGFVGVGQKVVVRGTKTISNNQAVISSVRDIAFVSDTSIQAQSATAANLSTFSNKLVSVYGLVNQTHTLIDTSYILETLNGPLNLVIPDLIVADTRNAIQSKLRALQFGLGVGITGVVRTVGSASHVLITSADQITVEAAVDPIEVLEVIKSKVSLPNLSGNISTNLTLVQNLPFRATITYQSSNEAILSNNGQVSLPDDDTPVTFTYTLSFNGEVIETKTFNLVVTGSSFEYTGYYATLNGLNSAQMSLELTRIISTYRYRTYDAARQILQDTDRDPNNPNNVLLIYNRASVSKTWDSGVTWNREHVWPQSYLTGTHEGADLHNLRAANPGINSARSNLPFRDSVDSHHGFSGDGYFPGDDDKGDVARILFYMVTRYTHLNINIMGILSQLIQWHIDDPVDEFELNRNNVIYSYQENRNPFIDHPHLVHQIWMS